MAKYRAVVRTQDGATHQVTGDDATGLVTVLTYSKNAQRFMAPGWSEGWSTMCTDQSMWSYGFISPDELAALEEPLRLAVQVAKRYEFKAVRVEASGQGDTDISVHSMYQRDPVWGIFVSEGGVMIVADDDQRVSTETAKEALTKALEAIAEAERCPGLP